MLQYFAKIIKIYNKYDKTLLNTCEFSQDVMYPCMHTDRDRQTDRLCVCVCVCLSAWMDGWIDRWIYQKALHPVRIHGYIAEFCNFVLYILMIFSRVL